ncbi:peptide chain release factor 1 [Lichenicoccus roseus]|uniref:Peptide chain release factor 1 n=1 Tax=Lichenicoccus roseus TaxID=2683649 RepID=A0A5R9J9R7_9PROT|nr:peptide chain release factor 1 [Lichenicoccus roseus]TLU70968.1 peptide chain release factor 1 [Lichenicoccus roseus]
MDDVEYLAKLDELDHLLNDPEIDAEPAQIWSLLAEVSLHDLGAVHPPQGPQAY